MSCQNCTSRETCNPSSRQQCPPVSWRLDIGKVLRLFAITSLVVAYFLGQSWSQPSWEDNIQAVFPKAEISKVESLDNVWRVTQGKTELLAALGTANSYGGPINVASFVDSDGNIKQISILAHSDTPAYIQKLVNNLYFRQYMGKPSDGRFMPNEDFDIISGATLSSQGIMRAAETGSHRIARELYDKDPVAVPEKITPTYIHGLIILILLMTLANLKFNNTKLKIAITLTSLVVLGFVANQMISVSNFAAMILGFVQSPAENLSFWLITGSVLAMIVVLGRNIYCGNICPFHGVQYLLHKVGGLNFPLHPLIRSHGKNIAKFGLWAALMVALLTTNPSAGAYEPFGMIFSLQGEGIQWYIMPATVIGSFLVPNLFCRYFCPAGEMLTRLTNVRNQIVYAIRNGRK